jgi:UDP-N-acetylmuramate: L-alanyl-gamma-D-glutamyl-meso-diaminopimelate ligase
MASLAGMLQARGHQITGSDAAAYPPMSDVLAGLGIPLMQPYAESNLAPRPGFSRPDLVIVGNAISRGNVELEYVLDTRIPFTSMAAVLHDEFLPGRESLVVAGTHGKTTTTSMLAWIYEVAARTRAELAPSFLIGGVAENFGTSFMVRAPIEGVKQPFILEGDEYDTAFFDKGPKFLHYFPDAVILTHVEFDHADIYPDLAAVKTAFKRLVNLVPRRGRVVAFDGSENVTECVGRAFCAVERYGFGLESHWRITRMRHESGVSHWNLLRAGEPFAELRLPMAGEHNALNATAAAALAVGQGVPVEAITEALATFRSVKRRLEVRAEVNGVTIIDDFAHHPTAIRETLRALRAAYPGRRLWAVLEPRSNTLRRNVFEEALVRAWRWRTGACWRGCSSRRRFRWGRGCIRRTWWRRCGRGDSIQRCMRMRTRLWQRLCPSCAVGMWWRFFRMGVSGGFMRSCRGRLRRRAEGRQNKYGDPSLRSG